MSTAPDLYEHDFYAWAIHNADLIRQGRFAEIDAQNIAEELQSMGRSEKRELVNRLAMLLAHLLKWRFQPEHRGNSWRLTITNQRDELQDLLDQSPSLQYDIDIKLNKAYTRAKRQAVIETGLSEKTFLASCPFTLEQVLDHGFWPED